MAKRKDGKPQERKYEDLTGQKFNRLTVLERKYYEKEKRYFWTCRCDCGNIVEKVKTNNLKNGNTKSCGCLNSELTIERNTKHGLTKHGPEGKPRLYKIWVDMRRRCNNPNRDDYERYGGRGITVCEEWNNDYSKFKEWADTNGYSDDLTIDRINVDGNYCPENCRWITMAEQAGNKQNTHWIEYDGKKQSIADWAKEMNVSRSTVSSRVRRGNSVEEVLKEYIKNKKDNENKEN